MADQAITALPKKTYSGSSQIASTDYLLGIDSAEGYQMLIQDLGEYIINRATANLAGSTQTLASAISALNSKINNPSITTIEALNTYLTNLPSAGRGIVMVNGTVANALIERNASAIATVARMDNTTADMSLYSLGGNYIGIIRYNFSTSTVTKKIEAAQKSDVEALNSKTNGTLLWSGSTTLDGGTITLSSPVTNFTWLLFVFKTNNEIATCIMKADHATTEHPYATIQAGEWITDANRFQYCAWSSLTKTSNTTYDVTCKYNNQNFICKPGAVWGF